MVSCLFSKFAPCMQSQQLQCVGGASPYVICSKGHHAVHRFTSARPGDDVYEGKRRLQLQLDRDEVSRWAPDRTIRCRPNPTGASGSSADRPART